MVMATFVDLYRPALLRSKAWWIRSSPGEWKAKLKGMSDVQKLVHLTGRMDAPQQRDAANRMFAEGRQTYKESVQTELDRWGCGGQKAVVPAAGPELSAIRDRADWAAESVANTYNVGLADALIDIGKAVPTANRHVYAHRLFNKNDSWDSKYWKNKATEIAQVETMTMIAAGTKDFYARNGDAVRAEAQVVPHSAVCPICVALVAGNPYKSIEAIYAESDLPVHNGCPHFAESMPPKRLTQKECEMLWAG